MTGMRSVRRARHEDASVLATIHTAARLEAMPHLPQLHSEAATEKWFRDVVLLRDEVHVAEEDAQVVAFVALGPDTVEQLYVLPGHQGRGIGSSLLELAKRRRPDGFRLYVFQRNVGARRFYERHGLRLATLGDGSGNEEGEPDAVYEWRPVNPAWLGRASRRDAP
jgi:ribosomal protein S18 acetylase RimI-like enzyme